MLCRHLASPGVRPRASHQIVGLAEPCAESLRLRSGDCSGTAHLAAGLRQRGCCGPCDDGRTGWRDPHGCASAGGTRAPCDGDGCSAGTYACSRISPRSCWDVSTTGSHDAERRQKAPQHQALQLAQLAPPARATDPRGPVVDMRHRSNRFRPANGTRQRTQGSIRRMAHDPNKSSKDVIMHGDSP